jgi:hypothetical protein
MELFIVGLDAGKENLQLALCATAEVVQDSSGQMSQDNILET